MGNFPKSFRKVNTFVAFYGKIDRIYGMKKRNGCEKFVKRFIIILK